MGPDMPSQFTQLDKLLIGGAGAAIAASIYGMLYAPATLATEVVLGGLGAIIIDYSLGH